MLQDQLPAEIVQAFASVQSVEEVDAILNQLSQSEQGAQLIQGLLQVYEQVQGQAAMASMKRGGKLDYFVATFKKGGKNKKCKCGCKSLQKGGLASDIDKKK